MKKIKKTCAGSSGCAQPTNVCAASSHPHLELPSHSSSPRPSFLSSLSHSQPSSLSQSLLVCFSILPSSRRIKIGATFPRSSHSPAGQPAETWEPRPEGVSGFRSRTSVRLHSGNNRVRSSPFLCRLPSCSPHLAAGPAPSCTQTLCAVRGAEDRGFMVFSPEQHLIQGHRVTFNQRWGACFL